MSNEISGERAAFEAWFASVKVSDFTGITADHVWLAWQAAIAHKSDGAVPYGYIHHFAPEHRPHDPIPVFSRLPKLPADASDFPGEVIEVTPLYTAAPVAAISAISNAEDA